MNVSKEFGEIVWVREGIVRQHSMATYSYRLSGWVESRARAHRDFASEDAAESSQEATLAGERVEGVVTLLPLRVDHQKRPGGATVLVELPDRGHPLGRRLHDAYGVVLGLRALRKPDGFAIHTTRIDALLLERRRDAGNLARYAAQHIPDHGCACSIELHDSAFPALIRRIQIGVVIVLREK